MSATPPETVPVEPIIVLGKENRFLYPVATLKWAIEYTNRYLTSDGMGRADSTIPQNGRFTLGELDFFDGLGRRLAPIVEDGALVDLVVDHCREIRRRINGLLDAARTEAASREESDPGLVDRVPATPADDLPFDEYLDRIVSDPTLRFDPEQNCNFILWLFGRCR
jgi:hypothetical protein